MADSQIRVPLVASSSFSGPTTNDAHMRPLKRRLSASAAETPYFTPTGVFGRVSSFGATDAEQMVPAPPTTSTSTSQRPPSTRSNTSLSRQPSRNNYNPSVNMDPSPSDPGVVFLRPPFHSYPDAHKQREGLTYNSMAKNPNWFLDPSDFKSPHNPNPDAIQYPSQLEPPRGWCPTKKKDMKGAWPEGEEQPRLRCTFCRRHYAGVNAKSMWRRHVYEKHKIPMANRRDTADRKGRIVNKENKEDEMGAPQMMYKGHEEGPSSWEDDDQHLESADWSFSGQHSTDDAEASSSKAGPSVLDRVDPQSNLDLFRSVHCTSTPPLTPGVSPTKRAAARAFLVESPYNPLQTPSFRHSPARLPSDQPWRFNSPSHPLHKSRDLSLAMLVRGESSPVVRGLDVSPIVILPSSQRKGHGIYSSPIVFQEDADRIASLDLDTEPRLLSGTPGKLSFGNLFSPLKDPEIFTKHRLPESPLGRTSRGRSMSSALASKTSWLAEGSSSPKPPSSPSMLAPPIQLHSEDPFTDLTEINSWIDLDGSADSSRDFSPPASITDESPVVRSTRPSSGSGSKPVSRSVSGSSAATSSSAAPLSAGPSKPLVPSGPGLMDAILSSRERTSSGKSKRKISRSGDRDFSLTMSEAGPPATRGDAGLDSSPLQVGKKTKRDSDIITGWLNADDGDSEIGDLQPRKRRRTFSGRA